MQDMATMQMQQHATSPAPASTSTGTQDAHEASRTDSEAAEEEVSCPACAATLASQHELTLHLRSQHGSGVGTQQFVCGVCGKALSSASSRDRHALVHSGERPFRCRVCGVAFTTNGNMHRHMRTHGAAALDSDEASTPKRRRESSCSSSGAASPRSPSAAIKRKASSDEDDGAAEDSTADAGLECPACDRRDFPNLGALEAHMEEAHADAHAAVARCDVCGVSLRNQRALNLHKYMVHSRRGAVVGFQDLTFVDFSSEKFPLIARAVCEQSLHRSSSEYLRFQCGRCDRAFPCASALSIHQQNCGPSDEVPADLSRKQADNEPEEDKKRDDFFHCLDLRNKSSPVATTPTRRDDVKFEQTRADLADIQSIISVTSAGSLLQDLSKSPPQSSGDLTPPDSALKDEEQQDVFAAEFRRMKLRGEFPCRLCASVFPNLRALKGHSRMHLSAGCCNVCPFSHSDRATLLRHMRSHNGDRPYECALCNYAFTTKANCERHLRNRHAKLSREDVKKSIIYHPSEDPTNDPDLQARLSLRQDVKRSLSFNHGILSDDMSLTDNSNAGSRHSVEDRRTNDEDDSGDDGNSDDRRKHFKLNDEHSDGLNLSRSPVTNVSPITEENTMPLNKVRTVPALRVKNEELLDPDVKFVEKEDFRRTRSDSDSLVNVTPKSEDSNFNKSTDEDQRFYEDARRPDSYECDLDSPLDLSMDALDLSKKKRESENYAKRSAMSETKEFDDSEEPEDLSKKPEDNFDLKMPNVTFDKRLGSSVLNSHGSILAQHMLSKICNGGVMPHQLNQSPTTNIPSLDQSEYFTPFNTPYSLFPHSIFPLSPYIVPPPNRSIFPNNNFQDLSEMKERIQKELIRGLRLSSGGSLLDTLSGYQKRHQQQSPIHSLSDYSQMQNDLKQKLASEANHNLPLPVEEKANPLPATQSLASKPVQQREAPSSVKMVIKNGVLMPKQKQRRYRTERPFACEHCSARFTLRSNMERHVKQQHPQLWSQRQRGNSGSLVISHSRRPSQPPPPPNVTCTDIREPLQSKIIPLTIDISNNDTKESNVNNNNNNNINPKAYISNEVKFALTQKLSAPVKTEDDDVRRNGGGADEEADDESELVIDEGRNDTEAESESRADLASVSRLLDAASEQTHAFQRYFQTEDGSEEDEDGLVAGSSDENRSESESVPTNNSTKKKSAYSLAPNRVSCPYCLRKFPWSSSLRRHVLTHTGQKPYKCRFCPLLFTTKSNCDRHLLRKHGGNNGSGNNSSSTNAGQAAASASGGTSSGSETSPGYSMRNVPERPYKCNHCPSSTFSTQSNLRKHLAAKHCASSPPLSPNNKPITVVTNVDDSPMSGEENNCEIRNVTNSSLSIAGTIEESKEMTPKPIISQNVESVSPPASELPFKCHLCEGSYGERQDALDHIKESHHAEYELLVSKGALEAAEDNNNINNVGVHEETSVTGGDEGLDTIRGKFPDYANRKVMCAFCMRRFWSAEDLRRHMRTHTGERPFSCDVCRRRFTLKHSMLRHRKKHGGCATAGAATSGDEDCTNNNISINNNNNNNNNMMIPTSTKVRELEESDLIGNLLGIQDRSIIDKVLQAKSADAAAKLLGV